MAYSIGDELTTKEFNNIIHLYRRNVTHLDEIQITDEVQGEYGKYYFDIQNAFILDSGLVITSETISAEPKVKLTDNLFKSSTYTLTLEIVHYSGVDILDDENEDLKVVETVEIELIPNTWVDIPVANINPDYIISFNASVEIKHEQVEVQGNYVTGLTLVGDKSVIQGSETATLTVTATDLETLPVVNKNIKIYDNSTLLDTITTGTDGTATKTITNNQDGEHNFQAKYMSNITSDILTLEEVIFYDEAIKDNHRQDWTDNGVSASYPDDNSGTVIIESSGSGKNYVANYTAEDNRIIEFDIMRIDGNSIRFYYHGGDNYLQAYLGDNSWHHVKIVCDNGTITPYIDGASGTVRSMTTNTTCRFILNNSSVKFKNFKIYEM